MTFPAVLKSMQIFHARVTSKWLFSRQYLSAAVPVRTVPSENRLVCLLLSKPAVTCSRYTFKYVASSRYDPVGETNLNAKRGIPARSNFFQSQVVSSGS